MDMFRNPWIVIGIIMAVLIGGSVWYSNNVTVMYDEGVEVISHIKGNKDATVKLVEYSDFECPACANFSTVVEQVMVAYGDQLAFEYKHFPLMQIHPHAEAAARAAEAAGQQGKFFEYHDVLFKEQQSWSKVAVPGALFVKYAEDLGLDIEKFKNHQRSNILRDKVRSEFAEARELGLTGTPSFFLNGERMQFQTYPEFIEQIENALGISSTGTSTNDVSPTIEFGV